MDERQKREGSARSSAGVGRRSFENKEEEEDAMGTVFSRRRWRRREICLCLGTASKRHNDRLRRAPIRKV